jgi:hypothetical protein
MVFVVQFAAMAVCSILAYRVLRSYVLRGALTDHKFALVFVGWFTLSLLAIFFGSLLVLGTKIDPPVIGLGFGIAAINAVLGYPVGYFGHRYFLGKSLRRLFRSPDRDSKH